MYTHTICTLDAHIPDEQRTMIIGIAAQTFGVVSLHPRQMNVVTATLEGKDSLVVQPTGAGKSMCFAIPPLFNSKTAIIINLTISLMMDQVCKLVKKGVSATLLGSAQKEDVMKQVEDGQYRVVYTTPESFYDRTKMEPRGVFLKMAQDGKLTLTAIDKAHLISSWKSFRYI